MQQDRTIEALRKRGLEVVPYSPWMRTLDCDLVHLFGSEYANADLIQRLRQAGVPCVVTSMFMPSYSPQLYRVFAARPFSPVANTVTLRKRILSDANHVIAISQQEQRELQQAFNLDPSKISVIANGIEQRFFEATKQLFLERYGMEDVVLCVGSIAPRKNQIRTAHALARLGKDVVFIGPAAKYGGAKMNAYVQEFRDVVEASPRLHWLGAIDHDDPVLASAYAAASVHVLASTIEAQGLVSMEATAAGAHAVVSDLPQLRELFTSDVEFCEPGSEDSIRQAVERALQKPRHDWSVTSRPTWLMSWDAVAERLDAVYRTVLRR